MNDLALRVIFISILSAPGLGAVEIPSASSAPVQAASLSDVLREAKEHNPDIAAARNAWDVKRLEIPAVSAWPNPTLSYVNEKFPSGASGVPAERIDHYRVEQLIPFPGKLTKDAAMKFHESQIAEARYRAQMIDVLNNVRLQYLKLYLFDQNIALARAGADILRSALKAAQSRLASTPPSTGAFPASAAPMPGDRSISDVYMAQVELRKMENTLFEEEQQRKLTEIELNSLLNRPVAQSWGATAQPPLLDLPVPVEDLEKLALAESPLYRQALHEMNHGRAMVERATWDYAPDFGVMYEFEKPAAGPSGRQIGASVSVPLWFTRPRAQIQSARSQLAETESASQGMENTVIKMVHIEYVETGMHLQLSRNDEDGILPATLSSARISRELYASGRGDFVRLMETVRSWIDANRAYQEELYHYVEHWSELERWVGIDLTQAKSALEELEAGSSEDHHEH